MAAITPTQSIRRDEHIWPFDVRADELIARLARLEPRFDVPYLTVTLDWTIAGEHPGRREADDVLRSQLRHRDDDGGSDRPSLRQLEQELNRLIEAHGPRGDIHDSLIEDREKILEWLRSDLDPAAGSAFIVANARHGVFEATGLTLPLETDVALAPVPRLYKVVRLVEDNPTYAVLVADQAEAQLQIITRGIADQSLLLRSSLWPRRTDQGYMNQARYQRRADERVEAFSRTICDETSRALRETGVGMLILAGSDVMMSSIEQVMPTRMRESMIASIPMSVPAAEHEIVEATLPIAEQVEREAEARAVDRLSDALGAGSLGISGALPTLRALRNGQVEQLVMLDTFSKPGWADYTMNVFGVDEPPAGHPLNGNPGNIHPVDLRDEMIRLALSSGAEVEIVHSAVPIEDLPQVPSNDGGIPRTEAAERLAGMGEVGAVLRYAVTSDTRPQGS